MRKIDNFAQISGLLNAQLKRGVLTNNFLRGEDYTREIENGLYLHEADGALLLFRERGTHLVMTFYLHPGAVLSLPETDRPIVTELSCRAKDAEAMANAAAQFCALGFREALRRTRRTRKPEPFPSETTAFPAGPADFADISRFLSDHFPPLTGCIPTEDDLRENLEDGHTVITRDEKGVSGVLHFAASRASTEIRHLAVREDCRRLGLAGELLTAYLAATDGAKSQVWARTGNLPAEHFYEKHGYRPDGWTSAVLQYH